MKVKKGLLSHKIGGQYVIVASGEAGDAFNGMIRSNQIAVEILNILENNHTEDEIVDMLFERYDAPRDIIAQDVHKVIEQIRTAGLLHE